MSTGARTSTSAATSKRQTPLEKLPVVTLKEMLAVARNAETILWDRRAEAELALNKVHRAWADAYVHARDIYDAINSVNKQEAE